MLPTGDGANDLYEDVRELVERAQALSRFVHVVYVDKDREPERAETLARRYRISRDDLYDGVVVVEAAPRPGESADTRSKYITRAELAEYDYATVEEGRPPRMKAWKGEQALVSALLAVTEERAAKICFVSGHGEPAVDSFEPGEYGDFGEELRRDHELPVAIELGAGVPNDCDLTVVAGPQQPLPRRAVAALDALLERGGRLLVLVGPTFDAQVTRFADTGLEDLLERWGALLRNDVVVDEPRLRASAVAFAVTEGYADHPITAKLMHHRTLWSDVREVRAAPKGGLSARELVHTSDAGWGETDLAVFRAQAELSYDPGRDVKGPLPIGVAAERTDTGKGARLVVLGSSELAANRELLGYNRDLLLSSVAWLLKAAPKVAIGPRTTEHVRLQLDDRQLTRIFVICVVALPLFVLAVGAGVFWVRRS
jgi:hypothetical protein